MASQSSTTLFELLSELVRSHWSWKSFTLLKSGECFLAQQINSIHSYIVALVATSGLQANYSTRGRGNFNYSNSHHGSNFNKGRCVSHTNRGTSHLNIGECGNLSNALPPSTHSDGNCGGFGGGHLQCQIYFKFGHYAFDYYNRMNFSYQGHHPPSQLAATAATVPSTTAPKTIYGFWFSDSLL